MPAGAQMALAAVGPLLHAGSWFLVQRRRASILSASGVTLSVLGVVALVVGPVTATRRFGVIPAVGVGLVAGVVLYAATVAFMAVARRAPAVARHTAELYEQGGVSPVGTLAVSLLLSVPGEELLWRGVVLGVLDRYVGTAAGAAVLAWAAFVAVNAVSGRIPIILAAVVGGGSWTALAWWTGGVTSSMACHGLWTALMILFPPPGARR
jgi:membrane protease YdiL (CAAX protease family)